MLAPPRRTPQGRGRPGSALLTHPVASKQFWATRDLQGIIKYSFQGLKWPQKVGFACELELSLGDAYSGGVLNLSMHLSGACSKYLSP